MIEQTQALRDVLDERERQIARGYTSEHDDQHFRGEIITDAGWGALSRLRIIRCDRTDLIEVAAMILAEIERQDRAAIARQAAGDAAC